MQPVLLMQQMSHSTLAKVMLGVVAAAALVVVTGALL
jgi:cell division protein FtsL